MKVRKQKLLSMLLCAALTITSVVSEGFQVLASGLQLQPEQQTIVEETPVAENEMPETQLPKEETEENILQEEADSTADSVENGTMEETETGTEPEETAVEGTRAEETEAAEDEEQTVQEESGITDLETSEETQQELSESEEELTEEVELDSAAEYIASGEYENITWVIDTNGKLTVTGTGEFSALFDDFERAPWYNNCESIISAEINVTGMKDASFMFYECENLINVDLSNFDTSQVTNMEHMFEYCYSITDLQLDNFDTSQVTNVEYMFCECNALAELDLSGLDFRKVVNAEGMLEGCINLVRIYTPGNLGEEVLLPMGEEGDDVWYQQDGTEILGLPQGLDHSTIIAKNKIPVKSVSGSYGDVTWAIDEDGKLTVTGTGEFKPLPEHENMYHISPWQEYKDSIQSAEINVKGMTDASHMFADCSELRYVDLSNFDTKTVVNMCGMFEGCTNLKSLNISGFNTENVTDMSNMFSGCSNLCSIDVSGFNTEKVSSMSGMFSGCSNLGSIDVSGFNTEKVSGMSSMFSGCSNLGSIDVSRFNTEKVSGMDFMFSGCSSLCSIDVSGFNTEKVSGMGFMFSGCSNLGSIDVSGFNTENVLSMSGMFEGCSSLISIDVSGFDTENVLSMSGMFEGCSSLITVDVSSFDTGYVEDMLSMFEGCSSLTIVDVGGFNTQSVIDMGSMFRDCVKLTSLDLSSFDVGNVKKDDYNHYGISDMLFGCDGLTTIYIPCNLPETIILPDGNWYQADGTQIAELPLGLDHSIMITKDKDSDIGTAHITAQKTKTIYGCGEVLDIDDLTVKYYDIDGTVKKITDYSTNKDEIDMSVMGKKTLKVSYKGKETVIELTVIEKVDDIAKGNYGDITWIIDSKGKLTVTGTGEIKPLNKNDSAYRKTPWHEYKDYIQVAEINVTGMTDASYMFAYCGKLKSVDMNGCDTGSITDMSYMFYGCSSLRSIDMNSWDMRNVRNMLCMFERSGLRSIDISGYDIGNVTSMYRMFAYCTYLNSVDMGGCNTGNVTNMGRLFEGCNNLVNVNLDGLNTVNVKSMNNLFEVCTSLESINVNGWDTKNVKNITNMFHVCINLRSLDLSGFEAGNVSSAEWIFSLCDNLDTIYTPCNLNISIFLPGTWYQPDGTEITELPQNLDYSMKITRERVPEISDSYITAYKAKTAYGCGNTLNTDDLTVKYYSKDGTVKKVTDYTTNADKIDMSTSGTKTLTITYNDLTTEIEITVRQEYTVTFELNGHGTPIVPLTGIIPNSKIDEPTVPTAKDWEFQGWYKDASCKEEWDFEKDTVKEDITLYAGWYSSLYTQSGNLIIQRIPALSYTGSALKPAVTVYYQNDDGQQKRLSAGKDYTVKYFNNIQADTDTERTLGGTGVTEKDSSNGFTKNLAYVVITCKGNYTGTVYQNFHIDKASVNGSGNSIAKGFTLKCTEQLAKSDKPLKPFTSLKYKKAMKAGKDYTVTLTANEAYNAKRIKITEGSVLDGKSIIPSIPAGYYGTFTLTVTGIGNYTGAVSRTLYVASRDCLMKNASVVLGKNQKSIKYTGEEIKLTPGWYDISEWKYYYAIAGEKPKNEASKKNIFTVRIGKEYLLYGEDFEVSYSNNLAVGTATMTIKGIGNYVGEKKVTFRITGTAFNAKNISVDNFKSSMVYTGSELKQDKDRVVLTDISWKKSVKLNYGEDYTISYKNNVKAGTATVIFTGNPKSGYSGSFKKKFKITPVGLGKTVSGNAVDPLSDRVTTVSGNATAGSIGNMMFDGRVTYTKTGAKISDRVTLTDKNTKSVLKEGTDYTVSYSGNKKVTTANNFAAMIVTGMGNYKGSINIYFPIEKASLSDNANLQVTATEISYNPKKGKNSKYCPKIKITDKKKALSASKDVTVEYINCSQEEVTSYLEALADGTATADARPYAIVRAKEGSSYAGSIEVDLTIYQKKLSTNNLYVVVSKEPGQITYTGRQVRPEVTVYYGNAKAVKKAKSAKETDDSELTDLDGKYQLRKLAVKEGGVGDYTLTYGANITAGKDKGSVTVSGTGMYSGKVTVKFTVLKKVVNAAGEKATPKGTVSIACVLERSDTASIINAAISFSGFRKRYCS